MLFNLAVPFKVYKEWIMRSGFRSNSSSNQEFEKFFSNIPLRNPSLIQNSGICLPEYFLSTGDVSLENISRQLSPNPESLKIFGYTFLAGDSFSRSNRIEFEIKE